MSRAGLVAGLLLLAGCGGGSGNTSTLSASWQGTASAYWIGKPSAGSAPVILFLFENAKPCSEIGTANWDKIIGNARVLEIGLKDSAVQTYAIGQSASIAYLEGNYNPDAESGSVTITAVNAATHIAGSFSGKFGNDLLSGTFDAVTCPTGVEP